MGHFFRYITGRSDMKLPYTLSTSALSTLAVLTTIMNTYGNQLEAKQKYDKSIEAMLIEKVGAKIGDIRPGINYGSEAGMVTKKDLRNAESKKNPLLQNKLWVAPEPKKDTLPPLGRVEDDKNVDFTLTSSISGKSLKVTPKLVWEKFNSEGELIHTEN